MHKRGLCRHAVSVCLCVCLCVCLSVTFVHSVETNKHIYKISNHRVPNHSTFSVLNVMALFRRESPWRKHRMQGGYEKMTIFDKYLALSPKWCKIEPQLLWKANRKPHSSFWMVPLWMTLSDLTPISRSRYYSTSNNSKMVQDRAIFTMADQ